MGCERQGGRSRNPAMCGDIAVMLIPSLLRRSGKSRCVAINGASGRLTSPIYGGCTSGSKQLSGEIPMTGIKWNLGQPPETQRSKRLLLIAFPTNVNFDAAADDRPDIYIGHFGDAE